MTQTIHDRSSTVPADVRVTSTFNWSAVITSVVIGFGLTILMLTIGAAAGAMADGKDVAGDDAGKIAAGIGAWTLIAALGGTALGSYIGGRYTRWSSRGAVVYHALAAWGMSVLLGVWLGALGATGLLGGALNAASNQPAKAQQASGSQAAEAIAMGGWAVAVGLALTMLVAIGAWWIGASRTLDDFEVERV